MKEEKKVRNTSISFIFYSKGTSRFYFTSIRLLVIVSIKRFCATVTSLGARRHAIDISAYPHNTCFQNDRVYTMVESSTLSLSK